MAGNDVVRYLQLAVVTHSPVIVTSDDGGQDTRRHRTSITTEIQIGETSTSKIEAEAGGRICVQSIQVGGAEAAIITTYTAADGEVLAVGIHGAAVVSQYDVLNLTVRTGRKTAVFIHSDAGCRCGAVGCAVGVDGCIGTGRGACGNVAVGTGGNYIKIPFHTKIIIGNARCAYICSCPQGLKLHLHAVFTRWGKIYLSFSIDNATDSIACASCSCTVDGTSAKGFHPPCIETAVFGGVVTVVSGAYAEGVGYGCVGTTSRGGFY